ncbi:TPA: carbohydrate ABC transporter substrate-binding protein, partial [Klebsiella pneumoniae]|nr:carbohydrate ABC transporter substrate-binding protein [Klebsiella pneumoniae]
DQLVQKFRVALASGSRKNLPNIIIEEDYNMQGYFKYYEDYFVDLSDHLDTDDYMDFKITSSTYNDKLLAVPYDSGVSALFYRLDIIQEAGYSGAELFCQLKLGWIGIDGKDAPRFCLTCALHHGQPDTAEAEYRHRIPFLYLRGIVYRADPGGHAAAEQANLLRIGLRIDFRQ